MHMRVMQTQKPDLITVESISSGPVMLGAWGGNKCRRGRSKYRRCFMYRSGQTGLVAILALEIAAVSLFIHSRFELLAPASRGEVPVP